MTTTMASPTLSRRFSRRRRRRRSRSARRKAFAFDATHFYFQDATAIRRVPFQAGDRRASGAVALVTSFPSAIPEAAEHWPKVFDFAQDGTLYVTNGSTQGQACLSLMASGYQPVFGAVFKVNADASLSEVAKGFRNPYRVALRTRP